MSILFFRFKLDASRTNWVSSSFENLEISIFIPDFLHSSFMESIILVLFSDIFEHFEIRCSIDSGSSKSQRRHIEEPPD